MINACLAKEILQKSNERGQNTGTGQHAQR